MPTCTLEQGGASLALSYTRSQVCFTSAEFDYLACILRVEAPFFVGNRTTDIPGEILV